MKMEEWKECKLGDIAHFTTGKLNSNAAEDNGIYPFFTCSPETFKINSYAFDTSAILLAGNNAEGNFNIKRYSGKFNAYQRTYVITVDDNTDLIFLFYALKLCLAEFKHISQGTATKFLTAQILNNFVIRIPPLPTQQKIAAILSSLDDKIELNNKINTNLEQQAQALFKEMFESKIQNVSENDGRSLGEIVNVIDNRGKTPPLEATKTDFPIIDVGTLNSPGRIINYKDCTKFVSKTTYETFFRAGHPKEKDVLLLTVGCNLALLKYYIGSVGCIAQNIVAFRAKEISSLYIYEYLKFIQPDLVSYDIGSAQPSIKVTHIIKHLIYIPTNDELSKFNSFAKCITEQIYNNVCENERLISIRDTLLPKLMDGEIEV